MIQWTNEKVLQLIGLVRGAGVLAAVAMVALAYIKARSLVVLLTAALTAGVFLAAINNPGWWQERISEETSLPRVAVSVAGPGHLAAASVHVVPWTVEVQVG